MTRWTADRVQRLLGRYDLQVVRVPPEGSLHRDLRRVIADRHVETVLDVGAHVGLYGQRLRQLGFEGRIVSFEPSPGPFEALRARADARWEAHRTAVGDRDGDAVLRVYEEHEELSSLRRPSVYGSEHFGMTQSAELPVAVRRLDTLATELGLEPASTLLKVDTQGHDLAVLAGGPAFVGGVAALQVEVPMFGLYEGAPAGTAMVQTVLDLGLQLVGMYPVHEHPRALVPVEFDALFARGAAAG